MAKEVQEIIYRPRLEQEIRSSFDHIVDVNAAHTLALASRQIIDGEVASALAAALIAIEADGPDAISRDPSREDVHFNFEATLISRTGPEIGGRIHVGRSRNDMGATIDRMRARAGCLEIAAALNEVRRHALAQAEAHIETIMPGYTHLQPAQPITFGFYCLGIAMALERDYVRLRNAYLVTNHSPMGAAAFAGTSFDIDRQQVAGLLGFDGIVEHALDSVASRDFLIELSAACASIGITWSRLAQDLYVWSTEEFGLIDFPDRVTGTSSIMPQKKNPVVLEYLKATGADNIGAMVSLLSTMRASHFTNSIDGVRASTAGAWQILETTRNSLQLTRLIVESCEPRREKMLERAKTNFSAVTDLADYLVRDCAISFRESHHIAGAVVRMAIDRGVGADRIDAGMIQSACRKVVGWEIAFPERAASLCSDPIASVNQRRSVGGPSVAEVARLHVRATEQLDRDQVELAGLVARQDAARNGLKQALDRLANDRVTIDAAAG